MIGKSLNNEYGNTQIDRIHSPCDPGGTVDPLRRSVSAMKEEKTEETLFFLVQKWYNYNTLLRKIYGKREEDGESSRSEEGSNEE